MDANTLPLVSLTGARCGDIVRGVSDLWNRGTFIEIVPNDDGAGDACVPISSNETMANDMREIAREVARHWRITESDATEELGRRTTDDIPAPVCLGQTCKHLMRDILTQCPKQRCATSCRLRFKSVGKGMIDCAREARKEEELLEIVRSGRAVPYWEVVPLLGNHTFVLARTRFVVAPKPPSVDGPIDPETTPYIRLRGEEEEGEGDNVLLDPALGLVVGLPPSRTGPLDLRDLAVRALGDDDADVDRTIEFVKDLTPGALRSALQKAARLRCRTIRLDTFLGGGDGGDECPTVPVRVYAAVVAATLGVHPGSFVPDLQQFVRGDLSLFKRVAVTVVEDASIPDVATAVPMLLAAAFACQKLHDWLPPPALMVFAIRKAIEMVESPVAIAWRPLLPPVAKKRTRKDVPPPERFAADKIAPLVDEATAWAAAHALLCTIHSFPSDEAMFKAIADFVDRETQDRLQMDDNHDLFDTTVNASAMVDHHAWRGVGHMLPARAGATFAERFGFLFSAYTGWNPRRRGSKPCGIPDDVAKVQRFCLDIARRKGAAPLPPPPPEEEEEEEEAGVSIPQWMHSGAFAAAVGPQTVNPPRSKGGPRVVSLGVHDPGAECVIWLPTRSNTRPLTDMTPEQSDAAVAEVRSRKLPIRSPLFDPGHTARFDAVLDRWLIDDQPWEDFVSTLQPIRLPKIPSSPPSSSSSLLPLPPRTCFGIEDGYEEAVTRIVDGTPLRAVLRAVAVMRQQFRIVAFPQPDRSGGPSTQSGNVAGLVAHPADIEAYQMLFRVAQVAPAALVPDAPPTFRIPNSHVLRAIERIIARAMATRRQAGAAAAAEKKLPGAPTEWQFAPSSSGRPLFQHQIDASNTMLEREADGQTAHFLVLPTGLGKTATTVEYMRVLHETHHRMPDFVLWTIPRETREEIIREVHKCGMRACLLDPTHGRAPHAVVDPQRFHVNVIADDHVRLMLDSKLMDIAHRMVLVVDECDRCYATTQRSNAAHTLAAVAWRTVCQTATPLRNGNCEQLAAWLAKTVRFPLHAKDTWLVAASEMIHMQIDLGIERIFEEVTFDPGEEWRLAHRNLLADKNDRNWLLAARNAWDVTDTKLVEEAEARGKDDGALLVARDDAHVDRLIARLKTRGNVRAGDIKTGPHAAKSVPPTQVVVVAARHCRGFNWAVRLGHLVTGIYPGNAADRRQMLGRLARVGQTRHSVRFAFVYPVGTILALLHQKYTRTDSMNTSLERLAKEYDSADLMRALQIDAEGQN